MVAPFNGVCSTDILVIRAKSPSYYGCMVVQLFSTDLVKYAERLSNGAKMPRIGWKDLAAYPVVVPPEQAAMSFTRIVEPLLTQLKTSVLEAKTLATLRDTLLPRLISGQLQLPKAESRIAEASAA